MKYTVTRQHQWPDGGYVVEISQGGIDYCNPDALAKSFPGEFEEFEDVREAVDTAIRIAEQWSKQKGMYRKVLIDHGATGGMTMPFDGMPLNRQTRKVLKKWAEELVDVLPKCDKCGEPIFGRPLHYPEYPDFEFCREYCADEWYAEEQRFLLAEEEARDTEIEV